jgi:triacylglycerol lipase
MSFIRPFLAALAALTLASPLYAERAEVTRHPVVLAHGMAGWDSIGGFHYFGNDWGTFVGDSCQWFEVNGCNDWLKGAQSPKTVAFQVTSLNNSEVRGNELFNQVLNFMATTGHSRVNLVGHSQGGFDIRKVAHRLKAHFGEARVGAMISISSPHRGTPYAKRILDLYARNGDAFCGALPANPDGTDPCVGAVAAIGDLLFNFATGRATDNNNIIAAVLQLVYEDYDANDGVVTGAKAFNQNYNIAGVAGYVGSIITAQDDGNLNPLLAAVHAVIGLNADGDGYCVGDCNNDGAAGRGDGSIYDMDDDGLVGLNSQQMGYRLQYTADDWTCRWYGCWDPLDWFTQVSATGYVSDINNPSSTQMTSHEGVLRQDHLDVISIGPDTLDEFELYAGLFNFIYARGY